MSAVARGDRRPGRAAWPRRRRPAWHRDPRPAAPSARTSLLVGSRSSARPRLVGLVELGLAASSPASLRVGVARRPGRASERELRVGLLDVRRGVLERTGASLGELVDRVR